MREKKLEKGLLSFLVILSVMTASLFAGGQSEAVTDESEETVVAVSTDPLFVFIDGKGNEVPIYREIERIVAINSGLSALLAALEQSDKVVGRDMFSSFPSSLRSKKVVGKSSAYPNLELIMECRPDLVLADAMFDDSVAEKLAARGVPVAIEPTSDPQGTVELVTRYGKLLGCEARAAEICSWLERKDAELAVLIETAHENGESAPVVFFENRKNYKSTSRKSTTHQYLELAGGINLAADESASSPTLSPEFIVKNNPDVIIRRVSGDLTAETMAGTQEKILNRPGLSATDAVKNGRVHIVKADLFLTVRYLSALYYHASWFYPETFRGVDPEDFNRELINFMFGDGEFDRTNETFVYP